MPPSNILFQSQLVANQRVATTARQQTNTMAPTPFEECVARLFDVHSINPEDVTLVQDNSKCPTSCLIQAAIKHMSTSNKRRCRDNLTDEGGIKHPCDRATTEEEEDGIIIPDLIMMNNSGTISMNTADMWNDIDESEFSRKRIYMESLYFVLGSLITYGEENIRITTSWQMLSASFFSFFGTLLLSYSVTTTAFAHKKSVSYLPLLRRVIFFCLVFYFSFFYLRLGFRKKNLRFGLFQWKE